jgi:hypothetical protein
MKRRSIFYIYIYIYIYVCVHLCIIRLLNNEQEWLDLGLKRKHIDFMTPGQAQTIFGFTKIALESSLQ